jgi:hypothetical protein
VFLLFVNPHTIVPESRCCFDHIIWVFIYNIVGRFYRERPEARPESLKLYLSKGGYRA